MILGELSNVKDGGGIPNSETYSHLCIVYFHCHMPMLTWREYSQVLKQRHETGYTLEPLILIIN